VGKYTRTTHSTAHSTAAAVGLLARHADLFRAENYQRVDQSDEDQTSRSVRLMWAEVEELANSDQKIAAAVDRMVAAPADCDQMVVVVRALEQAFAADPVSAERLFRRFEDLADPFVTIVQRENGPSRGG
jgi:hypothetical protein